MTINRKKEIKKILLVGLGNLGSNYIKAIFSLPFKIELYIFDKNSDQVINIHNFFDFYKNTNEVFHMLSFIKRASLSRNFGLIFLS